MTSTTRINLIQQACRKQQATFTIPIMNFGSYNIQSLLQVIDKHCLIDLQPFLKSSNFTSVQRATRSCSLLSSLWDDATLQQTAFLYMLLRQKKTFTTPPVSCISMVMCTYVCPFFKQVKRGKNNVTHSSAPNRHWLFVTLIVSHLMLGGVHKALTESTSQKRFKTSFPLGLGNAYS